MLFNGYTYKELPSSPETALSLNGSRSVRRWKVPFDGYYQRAVNLLGYARKGGNPGSRHITRQLPHSFLFGRDEDAGYMYADSIQRIEAVAPKGTERLAEVPEASYPDHDWAYLTTTYNTRPYQVRSDAEMIALTGSVSEASLLRYVVPKFAISAKYQTLPSFSAVSWVGPPIAPMTTTSVICLPEGDLSLKWCEIPFNCLPEWSTIGGLIGKANSGTFGHEQSLIGYFLSGTLLFLGPELEPIQLPNLTWGWNVTYRFRYAPYGQNYFFRYDSSTPGFQLATREGIDDNTHRLFPLASFAPLFTPPG